MEERAHFRIREPPPARNPDQKRDRPKINCGILEKKDRYTHTCRFITIESCCT